MKNINFYFSNKAHCINRIISPIRRYYWVFINYTLAKLWEVKIGKGCNFEGQVSFKRYPGSHISIGKKCIFNSSKKSNRIGVYSPCMFSTITKDAKIEIGDGCGFSGTVIGAFLNIQLGKNVRCGANTLITDSDWHTDDYRTGENREVIIEDNVWLGYGVKVLKGVHIGENSLIGANSVVTRDIPANVIAAGNPCKVIKSI